MLNRFALQSLSFSRPVTRALTRRQFTTTTVSTTETVVAQEAVPIQETWLDGSKTWARSYKVFLEKDQKMLFCACRHSKTFPYCDGSHKLKGDVKPIVFQAPETQIFGLCLCRQSKKADGMLCDGAHKLIEGWSKPAQPFPVNPPPPKFDPNLI